MRYLILLLSLTSCYAHSYPKFCLGDKVEFKVPYFFKNTCNGRGIITKYFNDSDGEVFYFLETKGQCPESAIAEKALIRRIK